MYVELHPDNLAFLSYQYPVGFRINTSQLVEYNILKDWYPAEDAAVFFYGSHKSAFGKRFYTIDIEDYII